MQPYSGDKTKIILSFKFLYKQDRILSEGPRPPRTAFSVPKRNT